MVWNGIQAADCVLPWFLVIVGYSMAISVKRKENFQQDWDKIKKAFVRFLKLIGNRFRFCEKMFTKLIFAFFVEFCFSISVLKITGHYLEKFKYVTLLFYNVNFCQPFFVCVTSLAALQDIFSNFNSFLFFSKTLK